MQYFNWSQTERKKQSGQIMALFSIFVLFIVVGIMALAVDMGLIYHSKAKVSRTVDAMAIRIVNRYASTHTVADRQRIAESIFEANFGILRSAETVTWAWTDSGTLVTSTSGETINATGSVNGEAKYLIEVNTIADVQTGVVVSNVEATALHRPILIPAFFKLAYADNPSYADRYEKFSHTESAEAERFPSANAIIIDFSGSMRSNGGDEGLSGNGTDDGAVVQFVESFDETRDYMLVVGFATGAKVIWPPNANGIDAETGFPYFEPSRNYNTANAEHNNITIKDVMEDGVAYEGSTNGAEGLREAAKHIQLWLNNDPTLQNAAIRKKIRINYIFMTDGDNNSFRTFIRGYGHGIDDNGNNDYTPPVLSVHNNFHADWPMVVKDQASIASMTYDGENLGNLLNGANIPSGYTVAPENVAGVAANFDNGAPMDDDDNRYARSRTGTSSSYENWNGLLVKGAGSDFDARWQGNLIHDTSINDYDDADDANVPRDDYLMSWERTDEKNRLRSSYTAQIPHTLSSFSSGDILNPGLGHNYHDAAGTADNPTSYSTQDASTENLTNGEEVYYITRGTTKRYYYLSEDIYTDYKNRHDNICDDDVNMTNERAQYLPRGTLYGNHQGTFVVKSSSSDSWNVSSRTDWVYRATSTSYRRTMMTQRIADFYPTYSYDGPTKSTSRRWSGADDDDTSTTYRAQRQFYSWKDGGDWDPTSGTVSEEAECNFLAGALAKVLRQRNSDADPFKWQDATIYTVQYGSGGDSALLKDMANDTSYVSNTNSATENEGLYYDVNANAGDLVKAFEDIANRIAVRISK